MYFKNGTINEVKQVTKDFMIFEDSIVNIFATMTTVSHIRVSVNNSLIYLPV